MAKQSNINYTRATKNIWFPSQREPFYDPTDEVAMRKFFAYWKEEKRRCLEGFYIADGQVFISGWLYWHTVYWQIKMMKTVNDRTFPVIQTPLLRDIDWEAAQNFERALDEGVFIELVGSRGFGKTVWQSSMAARYFSLINNSQVVVSAGNAADIKTVTDMLNQGLLMLHPIFRKKWLKKDWSKEIQAGFREPDGTTSDRSSLSQIVMKNFQDGNNSMAINGTRPIFHIIDEIGKIKGFIKCIKDSNGSYWANQEAAMAGIASKPTCLPFYTGTGGDMEVGKEAGEVFFDPINNRILAFDDIWENTGKIGWFMPVTKARMEYKEPKTLAQYLGINHPDLEKITILVSDEERCKKEWWQPQYDAARASGNPTSLTSFLAYWPIKPSDSFLVLKKNTFDIEAAKEQRKRLKQIGKTGTYVELFHDGEKITHKFSEKLPITQYPVKDQDMDAPVVIYEWPMEKPPYGLYVAGVDSYRQGKAEYSESLGVIYIIKRQHSIVGEAYQNNIVASYAARPGNPEKWQEQARMLVKMYNARTLVENDEPSWIEYMKLKGDAHYLEPQPAWLKEIVPSSSVNREYGVHRSSERVRTFLHGAVKRYLEEVVEKRVDEKGSTILEILGVKRVPDPMLLTEIIEFNEDGNFDREIAFSLACAMAEALDGKIGKITASSSDDPRIQGLFRKARHGVSYSIVGGGASQQRTLIVPHSKRRRNKLFI